MANIQINEYFEDDLEFERAYVGCVGDVLMPFAVLSGNLCRIATREPLLEAGIATCIPEDLPAESWPMMLDYNWDGDRLVEYSKSANPSIVAAARRFNELESAGELKEGMEL